MAEINLAEARRVLELTLGQYSDIRGRYWAAVYDAVYNYLTGSAAITSYRNTHKKEMLVAFTDAADTGWADAFPIDKEVPPMEAEQVNLLTAEQNAEAGYIDLLWQRLSALKKEDDFDAIHEAYKTADGYAKKLDSIYSKFKLLTPESVRYLVAEILPQNQGLYGILVMTLSVSWIGAGSVGRSSIRSIALYCAMTAARCSASAFACSFRLARTRIQKSLSVIYPTPKARTPSECSNRAPEAMFPTILASKNLSILADCPVLIPRPLRSISL